MKKFPPTKIGVRTSYYHNRIRYGISKSFVSFRSIEDESPKPTDSYKFKKYFGNNWFNLRESYCYTINMIPFCEIGPSIDKYDLAMNGFCLQTGLFIRELPENICEKYPSIISENGKYVEFLDMEQRLHREEDKPAIVYDSSKTSAFFNFLSFRRNFNVRCWFKNGEAHRDFKPATLYNTNITFHNCIDYLNKKNLKLPVVRKILRVLFHRDSNSYWYFYENDFTIRIQQWGKENGVFVEDMSEEDLILFRMKWGDIIDKKTK